MSVLQEENTAVVASLNKSTFGLLGGFDGDDAKFQAAVDLIRRLLFNDSDVTVEQVVDVLDGLPFNGRIALFLHGVSRSPARDRIVKELFDWCFQKKKTKQKKMTNPNKKRVPTRKKSLTKTLS